MFRCDNEAIRRKARAEETPKVRCYRCGAERPVNEMAEVGFEVYKCPGGCRHEG